MLTPDSVKTYIQDNLACEHVEVAGDGQHFEAVIVSTEFRDKNRVQQHQIVYRALAGFSFVNNAIMGGQPGDSVIEELFGAADTLAAFEASSPALRSRQPLRRRRRRGPARGAARCRR